MTIEKTDVKQVLNLEQKMVELRKVLPYMKKEQSNKNLGYSWVKADDVWALIQPKMNELGINFRVDNESNAVIEQVIMRTRNGEKQMFLYSSDLSLVWIDTENTKDFLHSTIKAVAWQDDPAKAKGSAWTYAVKYDLFTRFSIPMGELDPDNFGEDRTYKPQVPLAKADKELLEKWEIAIEDVAKYFRTDVGLLTSNQIFEAVELQKAAKERMEKANKKEVVNETPVKV